MNQPYQHAMDTCKARYLWKIRPVSEDVVRRFVDDYHVAEVLARIMAARGIKPEKDAARRIFEPSLNDLRHPLELKDMESAAIRVETAVHNKEKIVIYGDYDADGSCAAALLASFLDIPGADYEVMIPEREKDGYGLSMQSVPRILERNPRLVVTVDNGITAVEAVRELAVHGVDVVITDHHLPGNTLPDAVAVVDPMREDDDYPFSFLSGAGVAYKLAWALAIRFSGGSDKVLPPYRKHLVEVLQLVSLATVADLMPLVDENRALVAYGLRLMKTAPLPGMKALLDSIGIAVEKVSAGMVGYQLGPRINAAGRLGAAMSAYRLLRAGDPAEADALAAQLGELNKQRRSIESSLYRMTKKMVPDPPPPAIALAGENWHQGVLGIVAGRIAERFNRPAVMVCFNEEGVGKGSGRSIQGVNLKEVLDSCAEFLLKYGGHQQAAGLTVRREKWEQFSEAFSAAVEAVKPEGFTAPELVTDGEIGLKDCTQELCTRIEKMEPFGLGYPKPLFIARGVKIISDVRPMGRNEQHWSFIGAQDGAPSLRSVGFGMGARRAELDSRRREGAVDMVFEPHLNHYNGRTSVELFVKDIAPSDI